MTEESASSISTAGVEELSRSLKRSKGNYAFLVGAGTSRNAGIQTASELIDQWSTDEFHESSTDLEKEEWVEEMESTMEDYQNRYGFWFENRYTTREERRQFIKSEVADSAPTFEHIVLSSMMKQDYVPITLTPNFDDLIYDTFYLYHEERPFLVDHNAIAPQFKITHEDPMIVKLHGDYLYDNLKNTGSETEELESNIKDVLKSTLNEYGLVVLGYSGRDESIMRVLNSDEVDIPDYGLYWCTLNPDELSPNAEDLLQNDNTFLVEIEGSQDFFFELYNHLEELNVPTPIDIRTRAKDRAKQLKEGIMEVGGMEVFALASEYKRREEHDNAIELLDDAIENGEDHPEVYRQRASAYFDKGNYDEALRDYSNALDEFEKIEQTYTGTHGNHLGLPEDGHKYVKGKALSHARNGNFEEAIPEFRRVVDITESKPADYNNLAESLILAGDHDEGIEMAEEGLEESTSDCCRANSLLLIIIGKLLKGADPQEEINKFRGICDEGFVRHWYTGEIEHFLENNEIQNDVKMDLSHILGLFQHYSQEGPDRVQRRFSDQAAKVS